MRIALLGDVHADDVGLERALQAVTERDVQDVFCVGDIADGRPGSFDRCCELLVRYSARAVRGNHDRWLLEGVHRDNAHATDPATAASTSLRYLAELPTTLTVDTPAGRLIVCHALGDDDVFRMPTAEPSPEIAARLDEFVATTGARWVINGHTHQPLVHHRGDAVFINAGTVWRRHGPIALVLDLSERQLTCLRLDPGGGRDVQETMRDITGTGSTERLDQAF